MTTKVTTPRFRASACLLVPTPDEVKSLGLSDEVAAGRIKRARFNAVSKAVKAWNKDCHRSMRNVAVLYVAGHGLLDAENITHVALEDFGQTNRSFDGSLDIGHILQAMETTQARQQYFLIDACQVRMPSVDSITREMMGGIPFLENSVPATRSPYRCTIYSTSPGEYAFDTADGFGTVFSRSLLECLKANAVVWLKGAGWCVTLKSLHDILPYHVRTVAKSYDPDWKQRARCDISRAWCPEKAILQKIGEPPVVPFHLEIEPSDVVNELEAHFRDPERGAVVLQGPLPSHPYDQTVNPGLYILGFLRDGPRVPASPGPGPPPWATPPAHISVRPATTPSISMVKCKTRKSNISSRSEPRNHATRPVTSLLLFRQFEASP